MYSITDLKTGTKFILSGEPYQVLSYAQKKLGRGGSIVKVKIKNLINGNVLDKTFQGAESFEPADLSRKKAQYLYQDEVSAYFMDMGSYEQFEISLNQIGEQKTYLKENFDTDILYFKDKAINIELPIKMIFEVKDAPPSVKGNSQGSVNKSVKIETGTTVDTPLFINAGDKIVVDTRDGSYVERAWTYKSLSRIFTNIIMSVYELRGWQENYKSEVEVGIIYLLFLTS